MTTETKLLEILKDVKSLNKGFIDILKQIDEIKQPHNYVPTPLILRTKSG